MVLNYYSLFAVIITQLVGHYTETALFSKPVELIGADFFQN